MTELSWQAPPADSRNTTGTDWHSVATALKSRPGEWALIGQYPASHAVAIRTGAKAAFRPRGAFEARAKNTDSKRVDLYVRYIGEVPA